MQYVPLNFALMKNPFNWAIVTLMVMIGGLALHLLIPADAIASAPATTNEG